MAAREGDSTDGRCKGWAGGVQGSLGRGVTGEPVKRRSSCQRGSARCIAGHMTPRKLGFLLSASLALLSTSTLAGTLAVRDVAALLSPQDIQALQTKAATLPFDVHLLIEKAGSKAALEDHAHAWVDGPKVVVVGLDPAGHHVVARFGVQTGVKTGDFDTVTLAGNTHFRAGEFVPGIEAIWTRARASAEAKAAITTQAAPVIL